MFLINERNSKNWTLRTTDTLVWEIPTVSARRLFDTQQDILKGIPLALLETLHAHPLAQSGLSLGMCKQFDDGTLLFTLYETSGSKILTGRRFINGVDQCSATIETPNLNRFLLNQYGNNAVMDAARAWLYTATLT